MRTRRQELDVDRVSQLLRSEQAEGDLRRYFGVGLRQGELPAFEGGQFETLGGGGDRPEVRDRFTASDLLAVELLSVHVPPRVILDLLEGALGITAAAFLREIPASVPLWSDEAERLIGKGGPADALWRLLDHEDGVGWVTAGKLLARKRPALIPIYDGVVRCAMGWPKGFWAALRHALRQDSGQLRTDIEQLLKRAEVPSAVTPLRGLDVAIWMHHRSSHSGYQCAGLT
jgi:Family of unknown function (DUF6308)